VVGELDDEPLAHHSDRLPVDEQYVLCQWSVQAVAADLGIGEADAADLLEAAYTQGRVQILGTSMFAGVQVDGQLVVIEGRSRLTQATSEWQALRALERQFEQSED
jgi:hypothetical protein